MSLSPEDVEDILKVLDSTDYDELHLETERFVLRLRRAPGGWTEEHEARGEVRLVATQPTQGTQAAEAAAHAHAPAHAAAEAPRTGDLNAAAAPGQAVREGRRAVRAPLPGVLYRAPKPGEPPFVEVGDRVEPDTVVAILETMKLMNPVRAGTSGTVADFAVENGEPAEQGAVLLWLTPDPQGALEP